jgi:hypothetical protein
MVRILHISDPHGDEETLRRLDRLANLQPGWDVVALTGGIAPQQPPRISPTGGTGGRSV